MKMANTIRAVMKLANITDYARFGAMITKMWNFPHCSKLDPSSLYCEETWMLFSTPLVLSHVTGKKLKYLGVLQYSIEATKEEAGHG